MFSGCTVPHNSKQTKLGSSDIEVSLSASKNTGVVLVQCHAQKCVPTAISSGVDISEVIRCHVMTDDFSVRVTKVTSRIGVS